MQSTLDVAIIGGGPAGLMAAEVLSEAGRSTHVFDAMPSVGRKFLLAGIGGLNLTHSEPYEAFVQRYGPRQADVHAWLQAWDADAVRAWALNLGVETFVGSSGRVFPTDMKAAPLLRAWLHRLRHPRAAATATGVPSARPVQFHMRHRWMGWAPGPEGQVQEGHPPALRFSSPQGEHTVHAQVVVLALGGASWARLGSDGAWVPWLQERGVEIAPLLPSNCGFDVTGGWSEHFRSRHAGEPLKGVALTVGSPERFHRKGECVVTQTGVEGSLVYAASALLRNDLLQQGTAHCTLDLLPQFTPERVLAEVRHPRGTKSLSSHLKSRLGLHGVKMGLLHEALGKEALHDPVRLAAAIKALPLVLGAARPIDEAISTAGGVRFEALTPDLMLKALPGVYCAGEMLDWEAPTGGYLLTACLASGRRAGLGVVEASQSAMG